MENDDLRFAFYNDIYKSPNNINQPTLVGSSMPDPAPTALHRASHSHLATSALTQIYHLKMLAFEIDAEGNIFLKVSPHSRGIIHSAQRSWGGGAVKEQFEI